MRLETRYSKYLSNATLDGAMRDLDEAIKLEPQILATVLDGTKKPREGVWTRQEIVGHLIDSALNNHQRFVRAQIPAHLDHGALVIDGYAQDDWVRVGGYASGNASELVALWAGLNRQIQRVMRNVDPERLQTNIVINGGAPVTLEAVMVDYVGHVKHHLKQILE